MRVIPTGHRQAGLSKPNNNNSHIAAIINGVMQATRHENGSVASSTIPSTVGGNETRNSSAVQMPQHGTHARNTSAVSPHSASTQQRRVTYDHNGDIVPPS